MIARVRRPRVMCMFKFSHAEGAFENFPLYGITTDQRRYDNVTLPMENLSIITFDSWLSRGRG